MSATERALGECVWPSRLTHTSLSQPASPHLSRLREPRQHPASLVAALDKLPYLQHSRALHAPAYSATALMHLAYTGPSSGFLTPEKLLSSGWGCDARPSSVPAAHLLALQPPVDTRMPKTLTTVPSKDGASGESAHSRRSGPVMSTYCPLLALERRRLRMTS